MSEVLWIVSGKKKKIISANGANERPHIALISTGLMSPDDDVCQWNEDGHRRRRAAAYSRALCDVIKGVLTSDISKVTVEVSQEFRFKHSSIQTQCVSPPHIPPLHCVNMKDFLVIFFPSCVSVCPQLGLNTFKPSACCVPYEQRSGAVIFFFFPLCFFVFLLASTWSQFSSHFLSISSPHYDLSTSDWLSPGPYRAEETRSAVIPAQAGQVSQLNLTLT